MSNSIQDIISILSPDAEKALHFLSVFLYLDDELAAYILIKAGLVNSSSASKLVAEIRSFPIWHETSKNGWELDDDVREYAFAQLDCSLESTRRIVLNALREIRQQPETLPSSFSLWEFDLQLARLALTVEQEQPSGIASLRQFFDQHHDETSRVVILYIDEILPAEVPYIVKLPDYLQSVFFMRGYYAYKMNKFKDAIRFLEPVWKRHSGSQESCHDAAIAAYFVGLIWSREPQRCWKSELAFKESLELGKGYPHLQAQVWHRLGNLFSKSKSRWPEAKELYLKSYNFLYDCGDCRGVAMVCSSFGDLLMQEGNYREAWTWLYLKNCSIITEKQLDDVIINVSGHRLAPSKIESALLSHNSVAEAAVVGVPHPAMAQNIFAYVTLIDSVEESDELIDELRKHVRAEIGPVGTPEVIMWAPSLPKTRSGKIMRRILREIAANDFDKLGGDFISADSVQAHYLHITLDNEQIDFFRDKIKAQLEELSWKWEEADDEGHRAFGGRLI
jgi:tetratricopeptide (TPR) repeat protein